MLAFKTTALLAAVALASGRPTNSNSPVQVYIMMGQSNMLGEGKISPATTNGTLEFAVQTEHKYPYLVDSKGNWTTSKTVRYVAVVGNGNQSFADVKHTHNEMMSVVGGSIGPELGIGWALDQYNTNPTMCLKSCIGNRALGWDFLPPGSPSFDYTDPTNASLVYTYAGYHESPLKWVKGTTPKPIGWMAGEQYDGDTNDAQMIMNNLTYYYPGQTDYEVAGFFWWQGDKDSYDTALSERYEQNLVNLIKTLRTQFKAPNAKFVTASLGQTKKGDTSNGGKILDAMLNVDGTSGKYPDFKGNVAAVYTHPLSMGGASNSHYGGNAETYMNVGQAMGAAMVGLLKGDQQ